MRQIEWAVILRSEDIINYYSSSTKLLNKEIIKLNNYLREIMHFNIFCIVEIHKGKVMYRPVIQWCGEIANMPIIPEIDIAHKKYNLALLNGINTTLNLIENEKGVS